MCCVKSDFFFVQKTTSFSFGEVYYHLEEIGDALEFALNAGDRFDIEDGESEYVQTLIGQSIDEYILIRTTPDSGDKIDPRLENIVSEESTEISRFFFLSLFLFFFFRGRTNASKMFCGGSNPTSSWNCH